MFKLLTFFSIGLSGVVFGSAYDVAVLGDNPVLYLPLSASSQSNTEADLSSNHFTGAYLPASSSPVKTRLPNNDVATVFNGISEYVEVPSERVFSIRKGGALTLEAWIRPDVLNFPNDEGDGYVHWAGKGMPGQHEYAFRMYSKVNSAQRPNRISGYVFNLDGGLGSGSYFQDPVVVGKWIHVALVVNLRVRPTIVSIYKNGVLRKTTPLSQFDVVPQAGNAPLRIGTRDMHSFFKGAIGKFAIYAHPLTEAQMKAHILKMN